MNKINVFLVNEDNDGRRLDNYLFSQFKKSIPKSNVFGIGSIFDTSSLEPFAT